MADNYLEKKMAEHRAGNDRPVYRRKLTSRGTVPGQWLLKFTPCGLHVADASTDAMADAVAELAAAGFAVSFSIPGGDYRRGASLAQRSGAKFIPDGAEAPLTTLLVAPADHEGALVSRGVNALEVNGADRQTWLESVVFCSVILANANDSNDNPFQYFAIKGKKL